MAIKERALAQPISQGQQGPKNHADSKPQNDLSEKAQASESENLAPVNQDLSALIRVVEHLTAEKKPKGKFQSFLAHPFVLVIVSGFVGVLLTHIYTLKQKDIDYERSNQQQLLASNRSFSDELNKIRIQKFGEVWEIIDKNEITLDSLLSNSNNRDITTISSLIQDDRMVINKNRFWLGEKYYDEIKGYLDRNLQFARNKLLARREEDLDAILKLREEAKSDILKVRKQMFSEGESARWPAFVGR